MTETFFTSDLHLGHVNISRLAGRPFDDVDTMNETIIARWNEVVTGDDWVYLLGDLAMGTIKETLRLVGRLNGWIHLIPGNHDRCWKGHGDKADKWVQTYLAAGIGSIEPPHDYDLGNMSVHLNHFPYAGADPTDQRYEEHRPIDDGRVLVHGHVHEKWKTNGRMINVGVDVWDFRPVHESEILALAKAATT